MPAPALPVDQAAGSLGIAENHLRQHVLPHVLFINVGRVRLVPVIELERWLYLNGRFGDEEQPERVDHIGLVTDGGTDHPSN